MFLEFAGGEGEDNGDGICRRKREIISVQREKKTGKHPGCTLVTVYERVVARNTKGIGSRKRGGIFLSIVPLVDRTAQCGFEHAHVTHPHASAMFRELTLMNRKCVGTIEPDRFHSSRLLSEDAKNIPIVTHDFLCDGHFVLEVRIRRRQSHSIRRFSRINGIAELNTKSRKQLLGQNDPR